MIRSRRVCLSLSLLATLVLCMSCGSNATGALLDQGDPSGPQPIPANLWRAPAGATPASVSYLYLDADQATKPWMPYPRTIVPTAGAITVAVVGGVLTINAKETSTQFEVWGAFSTMIGHTRLDEGYYQNLRGAANADPLRGSIDVALDGHTCASPTGWFVVDHVFYFNGRITALDLRFEQRCPGLTAPTRGQLHWTENLT